MDVMARRRAIMAHVARLVKKIISSVTGLVSFTTNVIRPVKVTCEFSPIQEGSGDPSPTNVRPISGWTGANIEQRGKNLLDSSDYSGIRALRYSNGTFTETGTDGGPYTHIYFCRTYKNGRRIGNYSLVDDGAGRKARNITVNVGDIDTIQIGFLTFGDNAYVKFKASDVIVESGTYNISYNVVTVPTSNTLGAFNDVQISKTDSSYEPYHGTTIPIAFTDPTTGDPMTVYGGTLTLNEDGSADIVANKAGKTYIGDASESWTKFESGSASVFAMRHPLPNFINSNGAIIANYLKTIGKDASWGSNDNWVSWANPNVLVTGIKSITTVDAWKVYLAENPLTIVYNLMSSQVYHLDNVGQLVTFLGTNTIWTDTNGTNTATYLKHQS